MGRNAAFPPPPAGVTPSIERYKEVGLARDRYNNRPGLWQAEDTEIKLLNPADYLDQVSWYKFRIYLEEIPYRSYTKTQ
jgi:hypothetical protein